MNRQTLILTAADVRAVLSMEAAVEAVELAFFEGAVGRAQMPPKAYVSLPEHAGDFRAMPAYIEAPQSSPGQGGAAGLKWVNSHAENPPRFGLPSVMAVYILSDPQNGYPLSIMDATLLTAARTGAAAAVASRHLAPKSPKRIGFVGCGVQARWMLAAHRVVYQEPIELLAYDIREEAAAKFAAEAGAKVASLEDAAACDIVCTSTPGRAKVLREDHIRPGTHINAMGADAPGKQELDAKILVGADTVVVVDEMYQATHSGEINIPIHDGLFKEEQVFGTLGEVIAKKRSLARTNKTVTIFDSTGLAIQDVALARVLYAAARQAGIGKEVPLVEVV